MSTEAREINPAPLGLGAFSLTNLMFSFFNAGLLPQNGTGTVVPLGIVFGGFIQIIVGILSYTEKNTFGLVAFSSYGAFWVWFGSLLFFAEAGVIEPNPATLGVTLLVWGVYSAYLWIGTLKLNWGLCALFFDLIFVFATLGFGMWLGITWLGIAGGYLGILLSIIGFYLSFAEVTNWCFDREVLSLGGVPIGEIPEKEVTSGTLESAEN